MTRPRKHHTQLEHNKFKKEENEDILNVSNYQAGIHGKAYTIDLASGKGKCGATQANARSENVSYLVTYSTDGVPHRLSVEHITMKPNFEAFRNCAKYAGLNVEELYYVLRY